MIKFLRICRILLTLCLTLVFAFSSLPGVADFGDFSSDSDWGSDSDWDSGSSWDSDWSSSGSESYRSNRNRSDEAPGLWPLVTILIFTAIFIYAYKQDQRYKAEKAAIRASRKEREHWAFTLRSMYSLDQEFSTETVCDLYCRMQDAWGTGDISCLEDDFTPDAFAQYKRQLEAKNARDEHAHCIVHSVSADKMGWNETLTEWQVAVKIQATITAWDTDGEGRIISGSDTKRKQLTYAWEMRKSKNAVSSVKICPNCGAELVINAGAQCPHCETQLTAAANRWVLHSIKGVSQKTLD